MNARSPLAGEGEEAVVGQFHQAAGEQGAPGVAASRNEWLRIFRFPGDHGSMSTKALADIGVRGTVLPPEDLRGLLDLSRFLAQHTEPAVLVGPDGEQIPLPIEVYSVLVQVVEAMGAERAVTIAPVNQQLTTQEAADLLGVSRPTVIKLIESGKLACEKPTGSRHRRLLLTDVLGYQTRLAAERAGALDRLVEDAEEAGLYDVSYEDFQTAVREARRERGKQ